MAVVAVTTLTKYALAVIDMQIEGIWHAKQSYEFALDFLSEVSSSVYSMYPCMEGKVCTPACSKPLRIA
jgi:hypothetical protein